jgi:serine/threonine protein kinase
MVYDADRSGDIYFIAMEYVEGTDLARLVKQTGPLSVARACDYARQTALGLQHAHEAGLVHRDIKPHNLMLTYSAPVNARGSKLISRQPASEPESNGRAAAGLIKILDLGLVRLTDPSDGPSDDLILTRPNSMLGTPDYISPEQARNSHDVDIRSDLYSLGCTLYFLLTGLSPFHDRSPLDKIVAHQSEDPVPLEEVQPEVPTPVGELVRRLMAKRPDERFAEPQDAADALTALMAKLPSSGVLNMPLSLTATITTPAPDTPPTSTHRPVPTRRTPTSRQTFAAHSVSITAMTFSPDGRWLMTAALDESVRVWDLSTPEPVQTNEWRSRKLTGVTALAVRPDRPWLAVARGHPEGPLGLWDWGPSQGAARITVTGQPRGIEALAFAPSGDRLAVAGADVIVWALEAEGVRRLALLPTDGSPVKAVAFSPDGQQLASAGNDGVIRLWEPERWWSKLRARLGGREGPLTRVVYSPDGSHLAAAGLDHRIRIWSVAGREAISQAVLSGFEGSIRIVQFLDGQRLIAADDRGQAIAWDLTTGQRLRDWSLELGMLYQMAFSPRGLIAGSGTDGRVTLIDLELGSLVR